MANPLEILKRKKVQSGAPSVYNSDVLKSLQNKNLRIDQFDTLSEEQFVNLFLEVDLSSVNWRTSEDYDNFKFFSRNKYGADVLLLMIYFANLIITSYEDKLNETKKVPELEWLLFRKDKIAAYEAVTPDDFDWLYQSFTFGEVFNNLVYIMAFDPKVLELLNVSPELVQGYTPEQVRQEIERVALLWRLTEVKFKNEITGFKTTIQKNNKTIDGKITAREYVRASMQDTYERVNENPNFLEELSESDWENIPETPILIVCFLKKKFKSIKNVFELESFLGDIWDLEENFRNIVFAEFNEINKVILLTPSLKESIQIDLINNKSHLTYITRLFISFFCTYYRSYLEESVSDFVDIKDVTDKTIGSMLLGNSFLEKRSLNESELLLMLKKIYGKDFKYDELFKRAVNFALDTANQLINERKSNKLDFDDYKKSIDSLNDIHDISFEVTQAGNYYRDGNIEMIMESVRNEPYEVLTYIEGFNQIKVDEIQALSCYCCVKVIIENLTSYKDLDKLVIYANKNTSFGNMMKYLIASNIRNIDLGFAEYLYKVLEVTPNKYPPEILSVVEAKLSFTQDSDLAKSILKRNLSDEKLARHLLNVELVGSFPDRFIYPKDASKKGMIRPILDAMNIRGKKARSVNDKFIELTEFPHRLAYHELDFKAYTILLESDDEFREHFLQLFENCDLTYIYQIVSQSPLKFLDKILEADLYKSRNYYKNFVYIFLKASLEVAENLDDLERLVAGMEKLEDTKLLIFTNCLSILSDSLKLNLNIDSESEVLLDDIEKGKVKVDAELINKLTAIFSFTKGENLRSRAKIYLTQIFQKGENISNDTKLNFLHLNNHYSIFPSEDLDLIKARLEVFSSETLTILNQDEKDELLQQLAIRLLKLNKDLFTTKDTINEFENIKAEFAKFNAIEPPIDLTDWQNVPNKLFFQKISKLRDFNYFNTWFEYRGKVGKETIFNIKAKHLLLKSEGDVSKDTLNLKRDILIESNEKVYDYISHFERDLRIYEYLDPQSFANISLKIEEILNKLRNNKTVNLEDFYKVLEETAFKVDQYTVTPGQESIQNNYVSLLIKAKSDLPAEQAAPIKEIKSMLEEGLINLNSDISNLQTLFTENKKTGLFLPVVNINDNRIEDLVGEKQTLTTTYPILLVLNINAEEQQLNILKKIVVFLTSLYSDESPPWDDFNNFILLELIYELGLLEEPGLQRGINVFKKQLLIQFQRFSSNNGLQSNFETLVQYGANFGVFTENKNFWLKELDKFSRENSSDIEVSNLETKDGEALPLKGITAFSKFIAPMDNAIRKARTLKAEGFGITTKKAPVESELSNVQYSSLINYIGNGKLKAEGRREIGILERNFDHEFEQFKLNLETSKEKPNDQQEILLRRRLGAILKFFEASNNNFPQFSAIIKVLTGANTIYEGVEYLNDYKERLANLDLSSNPMFYWLIKLDDSNFQDLLNNQIENNTARFIVFLDLVVYELFNKLNLGNAGLIIELIKFQNINEIAKPESIGIINDLKKTYKTKPIAGNIITEIFNLRDRLMEINTTEDDHFQMLLKDTLHSFAFTKESIKRQGKNYWNDVQSLLKNYKYIINIMPGAKSMYITRSNYENSISLHKLNALDKLQAKNAILQKEIEKQKRLKFMRLAFPTAVSIAMIVIFTAIGRGFKNKGVNKDFTSGINKDPKAQVDQYNPNTNSSGIIAGPTEGVQNEVTYNKGLPLPDQLDAERIKALPDIVFMETFIDNTGIEGSENIFGIDDSSVLPFNELRNDNLSQVTIDTENDEQTAMAEIQEASKQYPLKAYRRNLAKMIMPSNWDLEIVGIYTFNVPLGNLKINAFGGIIVDNENLINGKGTDAVIIVVERPKEHKSKKISDRIIEIPDIKLATLNQSQNPVIEDVTQLLPQYSQGSYELLKKSMENHFPPELLSQQVIDLVVSIEPYFNDMEYTYNGFNKYELGADTDIEVLIKLLKYIHDTNCSGAGSGVSGLFDTLSYPTYKVGLNSLSDTIQNGITISTSKVGHTYTLIPTADGMLVVDFTPSKSSPGVKDVLSPNLSETGTKINTVKEIKYNQSDLDFIKKHFTEGGLGLGLLFGLGLIIRTLKKTKGIINKSEQEVKQTLEEIIKKTEEPIQKPKPLINTDIVQNITQALSSNTDNNPQNNNVEEINQKERKLDYFEAEFLSAILLNISLADYSQEDISSIVNSIIKLISTKDILRYKQRVKHYINSKLTQKEYLSMYGHKEKTRTIVQIGNIFKNSFELMKKENTTITNTSHFFEGMDENENDNAVSVYTAGDLNLMAANILLQLNLPNDYIEKRDAIDSKLAASKEKIRLELVNQMGKLTRLLEEKNGSNFLLAYFLEKMLS